MPDMRGAWLYQGRKVGGVLMAEEFLVVYNHLPELAAEIEKVASQIVRKAAFDIQALAQTTAPVRTGFLKSSIYTVTKGESTYSTIEGSGPLLPEVDQPSDDRTAYVAVGAEYGIYLEFGTSHMSAQPYLIPAAETVQPAFIAAMTELEEALKLGGLA